MKKLTEHVYYFSDEETPILYAKGRRLSVFVDSCSNQVKLKGGFVQRTLPQSNVTIQTSGELNIKNADPIITNETIAESCSATFIFQQRFTLEAEDVTAKIFELEHRPDHLLVYFPQDRVLYLGNILKKDFQDASDDMEKVKMLVYIVETLQCDWVILYGHQPFEKEKILDYLYRKLRTFSL